MGKLLVLLLLLLPVSASAQAIRGKEFTLTGRLLLRPPSTPHCGTLAVGVVAEFDILLFSDTTYTARKVGVIVCCPEFQGADFYVPGKTYQVHLADQNQADFGWLIPNEAELKKYPLSKRFWVLDIKKLD